MTRNPTPSSNNPTPILNGAEGSRLRAPSHTQNQANTGAKMMMNHGLADWYHEAGCSPSSNQLPSAVRLVYSNANVLNVVPCCSNPPQKSTAQKKNTMMTPIFFFAEVSRPP